MSLYERITLLLSSLAYFAAGTLIITHPKFFYYCVAAIFILQGVVSLVRSLAQNSL